jgi:arylsulfatase A-like enzyme
VCLTALVLSGVVGVRARAGQTPPAAKAHRPLNFIIILIDDLGWRDLGCCGSTFYETPHVDALARRGLRFTQAYAACPVCSPSRAALLTGKYPARLHLTDYVGAVSRPGSRLRTPDWKPYLDPSEPTMARLLKKADDYTCGCIGKWHLGGNQLSSTPEELWRYSPERHGFDFSLAAGPAGQPPDYFFPYRRLVAGKVVGLPNLPWGYAGEYLTDRLTDAAGQFIERHRDRPFFLYFSHYAVHTAIGDRLQGKPAKVDHYRARIRPGEAQNNPVYAAMVDSMDESVGRVVRKLEDLKLTDRTVVFFTSDNGGYHRATSNLPLRGAKSEAYEGGIRVPLIAAGPGIVPGESATPVTGTDFLPTLLELAGVNPGKVPVTDGESLLPLLRRTGRLQRDAIYWHYPHYNGSTAPFSAVRQRDLKLIEFLEDGRLELYDLAKDPGESRNLATEMPEKAKELQRLLASWRTKVGAQMPTPNTTKRSPGGR